MIAGPGSEDVEPEALARALPLWIRLVRRWKRVARLKRIWGVLGGRLREIKDVHQQMRTELQQRDGIIADSVTVMTHCESLSHSRVVVVSCHEQ
jgi:hypothetical protein